MIKMKAGVFKAKCLKVMDDVKRLKREVVITKFGKPVAKLVPVDGDEQRNVFGYLKGAVQIKENIVAPLEERWNADG